MAEGNKALRIPFARASGADRSLKGELLSILVYFLCCCPPLRCVGGVGTGLCIQGNNGASTHVGTLQYAIDW